MTQPRDSTIVPAGRFELLLKPGGAACNLACDYCFYPERERPSPPPADWRMPDEVLESLTRQYLEAREGPEVTFAWQGGEPTLLGLAFFERAVAHQRRFAQGKRVRNTLQTNGTLLDERWGAFLAEHGFLVGLSLDGPARLHDAFRRNRRGGGAHADALRGLGILQRFGVPFNTLTAVNRLNAREPLAVYDFLNDCGSTHWQFIPVVERLAASPEGAPRLVGPARMAVTRVNRSRARWRLGAWIPPTTVSFSPRYSTAG